MQRNSMEGMIDRVFTPQAAKLAPHLEELKRKSELLRKVAVLRDGTLFNRGKVEGEESKAYCWVNINAERQLTYQNLGWTKCDASSQVKTSYQQDDGTHVRGDLILYEIDKEMAEALQALNVLRGMELVEGAKDQFTQYAEGQGIPTFTPRV